MFDSTVLLFQNNEAHSMIPKVDYIRQNAKLIRGTQGGKIMKKGHTTAPMITK